jgi:hypothetical protein
LLAKSAFAQAAGKLDKAAAQFGAIEPGAAHDGVHDLVAEQLLEARLSGQAPFRHTRPPVKRTFGHWRESVSDLWQPLVLFLTF